MSIRLDDQVAIVTGAGQGLGRCRSLALAKRGARVVVNDLGDESGESQQAAAVVNEITAAGGFEQTQKFAEQGAAALGRKS